MRIAFPLLLALVLQCSGETRVTLQYENLAGVALYSNGYLYSWECPEYDQFMLYGPETQRVYSVPEHKDGTRHHAWAVDSDGVAAVAYEYPTPWEGHIDLLDPSGKLALSIKTGSYIPQHITFSPDHTLWIAGYNAGNDGSREDFNVLHHYARSGQELGQALLWSQIAGDHNAYTALQPIIGGRQLFVGKDRIGFKARSHTNHSTWIEVSFSGVLLGKYDLGNYRERCNLPVAMTSDSNVYAAIYKEDHFDGWAALDRSKQAWQKIAGYPKGGIIGSDGDNLVFAKRDGGWTILQIVSSRSLRSQQLQQHATVLVTRP